MPIQAVDRTAITESDDGVRQRRTCGSLPGPGREQCTSGLRGPTFALENTVRIGKYEEVETFMLRGLPLESSERKLSLR